MSSELDRLLRDAREALPGPDDAATARARGRAIAPPRTSRARGRILVLTGATLVAAIVLGVTAGSLTAPTGAAAREPAALGFVPEPGWFALQSPPPVVPGQQTVAVAANVPFARDDTIHGLVEPSGLPYSTLLGLPPKGIVVVASMTSDTPPHRRACAGERHVPGSQAPAPTSRRRLQPAVGSSGATRPAAGAAPVARENRPLRRRRRRLLRRVVSDRGATRCRSAPARRARDPAGEPTAARGTDVIRQPLLRSLSSTTRTCATRRCSVACTSSRIVRMRAFVRDPDGRSSRMWSPEVGDGPPR